MSPEDEKNRTAFYMEEYKSLKGEIDSLVKETRQLELYAIAAIAGFYAWLINAKIPQSLAWYVPTVLVVIAVFRYWALFLRLNELARYLIYRERQSKIKGWETYLNRRLHLRRARFGIPLKSGSKLYNSGVLFWVLLAALTCIAPKVLLESIEKAEKSKAAAAQDAPKTSPVH